MKAGVKKHTHLVILLLTALNAFGGWHDSAPFVAWPATNHLRWVDNVGVYTNASNPTNSGYGAWTNNYVGTNLWTGASFDIWMSAYSTNIAPLYYTSVFGFDVAPTMGTLNAKDVRLFDCTMATLERHLILSSANTVSNFIPDPFDLFGTGESVSLYRGERNAIAWFKTWVKDHCTSFYYPIPTNSTPTNWVAFTPATLCSAASVPTNFLTYTPYRSADGSWDHYRRVMTNMFILRQGTNATHVATNSLVDSAGIEFTAVGTNGLTVTRYATNVNQQAGTTLGEYGWDGLRRVVTNLCVTVKTPTWGIGAGTNDSSSYASNFTYTALVNFTAGEIGAAPDGTAVGLANTAANPNLPYMGGGFPTPDTWEWEFNTSLTNPTPYIKTNTAPHATLSGSFDFRQRLRSSHDCPVEFNGYQWVQLDTNWVVTLDTRDHSRAGASSKDVYAAPIVYAGSATNVNRTILLYASTNSVSFLASSNYLSGVSLYTSTPLRVSAPEINNFGFSAFSYAYFEGGWNFYNQAAYIQSFFAKTSKYLWDLGGSSVDRVTASTNYNASMTIGKAVEIWDFEYK